MNFLNTGHLGVGFDSDKLGKHICYNYIYTKLQNNIV